VEACEVEVVEVDVGVHVDVVVGGGGLGAADVVVVGADPKNHSPKSVPLRRGA